MELAKFKLEVYDLLGTLIPGIFALGLCGYLLLPGSIFQKPPAVSGPRLSLLLICGFAAGQVIQEASDVMVRWLKGPRFLKQCRDQYWTSVEAEFVRARILSESGVDAPSVDTAFEYCLSSIGPRFMKRDTFIAISDMSRSLWCLSILAIGGAVLHCTRIAGPKQEAEFLGKTVLLSLGIAWLCWRRMVRFRTLSEAPVFSTFLALPKGDVADAKPDTSQDGES